MTGLLAIPGVMASTIDRCAYGLTAKEGDVAGPAKKPTRIVTTLAGIDKEMGMKCPACVSHVQLVERRAANATVYTRHVHCFGKRGAEPDEARR